MEVMELELVTAVGMLKDEVVVKVTSLEIFMATLPPELSVVVESFEDFARAI